MIQIHRASMSTGALLVGMLCMLVGYWAPWIAHPAVGLVQNGFDLGEFTQFLPQVKAGDERLIRWLFLLPLTTMSLSIGLLTSGPAQRRAHRLRLIPLAGSLVLLAILTPPYPYTLDRLLGPEFRARTILSLISWIAFPLTLISPGRWMSDRWIVPLTALLTLVGAVGPIAQFLSLYGALSAVYRHPITIGWGTWLMIAGTLPTLGSAALWVGEAWPAGGQGPTRGS